MFEDFMNKKGFKHWIRGVVHSQIQIQILDFFGFFRGLYEDFLSDQPLVKTIHKQASYCQWNQTFSLFQNFFFRTVNELKLKRSVILCRSCTNFFVLHRIFTVFLFVIALNSDDTSSTICRPSLSPDERRAAHLMNDHVSNESRSQLFIMKRLH